MKKNSIRLVRYSIFSIICCIFVFPTEYFTVSSCSSSSSPFSTSSLQWWNNSYSYRIPLLISNPSSESIPAGYTSKVTINSAQLIAAGKMTPNGQDLRLVWYNENNNVWIELDRVIESGWNTTNTIISFSLQIKLDTSDSNYFFYYGNKNATNAPSDASKVYLIYSDFNITDGSVAGWSTNSGIWEVRDQVLRELDSTILSRTLLNDGKIQNGEINVKVKCTGTDIGAGIVFRYQNDKKNYVAGIGISGNQIALAEVTNNKITIIANNGKSESLLYLNRWYQLKVKFYETNICIFLNDTLELNTTDSSQNKVGLYGLQGLTADSAYFDDFSVREISLFEPIVTSYAEEEYEYTIEEISDPLEMGEYLDLSIDFGNIDNILQVLIEYENSNHSMEKKNKKFSYKGWKPELFGSMNYSIHIQYTDLSWISITQSLLVRDTKKPEIIRTINRATKIESGAPIIIDIEVADTGSGIQSALFEMYGQNYSMYIVDNDTWRCDQWYPTEAGVYPFQIFLYDAAGNMNILQNSISIEITSTLPTNPNENTPDQTVPDESQSDDSNNNISNQISPGFIIGILLFVLGSVVIVSRPKHSVEKSYRNKVSLKSTLIHLRKIAEVSIKPESVQKASKSVNTSKFTEITLQERLPENLRESYSCAENAQREGAFLETAGRYSAIAKELESKGLKDLSLLFQNKAQEIQRLLAEREKLEEELRDSEAGEKKLQVGKLIIAILEISQKLNDEDTIKEYQSKLEQIEQTS